MTEITTERLAELREYAGRVGNDYATLKGSELRALLADRAADPEVAEVVKAEWRSTLNRAWEAYDHSKCPPDGPCRHDDLLDPLTDLFDAAQKGKGND